jgi:hypothetical protein
MKIKFTLSIIILLALESGLTLALFLVAYLTSLCREMLIANDLPDFFIVLFSDISFSLMPILGVLYSIFASKVIKMSERSNILVLLTIVILLIIGVASFHIYVLQGVLLLRSFIITIIIFTLIYFCCDKKHSCCNDTGDNNDDPWGNFR